MSELRFAGIAGLSNCSATMLDVPSRGPGCQASSRAFAAAPLASRFLRYMNNCVFVGLLTLLPSSNMSALSAVDSRQR